MDRSRFLDDLTDVLDGAADDGQVALLEQTVREDAELSALAFEQCLLDLEIAETFEDPPSLPSTEKLLERGKKRLRILGESGSRTNGNGNGEQAPSKSITPKPRRGRARQAGKRTTRPDARRPGRGERRGARERQQPSRVLHFLAALAALVAVAVVGWWVSQREQPRTTEPDVVKKKDQEPTKKDPVEKKVAPEVTPEPEQTEGPILAVKGGVFEREGNTIKTDHRSVVDVSLADGSSAQLHPNTTVSFKDPTAAARQDLAVKEGRVVLSVEKDPRSFVVRVGESELHVIGTRFVFHVANKKAMAAGKPSPALVEVQEGVVRLKNRHGQKKLEREHGAILCDAFAPMKLPPDRGHPFVGFDGRLRGELLFKDGNRLLLKVKEAIPNKENKLDHPNRMAGHAVWLHLPPGEHEEAEFHAKKLLEEVRVMSSLLIASWSHEGLLVFHSPEMEEKRRKHKEDRERKVREEEHWKKEKHRRKMRERAEREKEHRERGEKDRERGEREREHHRKKKRPYREEERKREGGDREHEGDRERERHDPED